MAEEGVAAHLPGDILAAIVTNIDFHVGFPQKTFLPHGFLRTLSKIVSVFPLRRGRNLQQG
jgi:hypothetical protein